MHPRASLLYGACRIWPCTPNSAAAFPGHCAVQLLAPGTHSCSASPSTLGFCNHYCSSAAELCLVLFRAAVLNTTKAAG